MHPLNKAGYGSITIGALRILGLVWNEVSSTSRFWTGVQSVADHCDILGGAVWAALLIGGIASVPCYKPWRRWADPSEADPAAHIELGQSMEE